MYARTVCACSDCVNCCKTQPGSLLPGDLEKIAEHLQQPMAEVKKLFWSSPGALVMDSQTGVQFRIRTITPRYDRRLKRCVFLNDQDRCTIHPVSPFGCSHVDTHMTREHGAKIAMYMATAQTDPAYQQLRKELPVADHYKPRPV